MNLKIYLSLVAIFTLSFSSPAQNKKDYKYSLNLSVGRILLGTGDIPGVGVVTEYSFKFSERNAFLEKLQISGELKFEAGATQPKIINPTLNDFFYGPTFRQSTNITFSPKLNFYPLSTTFLKGLNIGLGPSIGYTFQSREFQATLIFDSVQQINVRRSYLEYNNGILLGYRVTAGYSYPLSKHIQFGIRLDFDSYQNSDINTLLAGRIGYKF